MFHYFSIAATSRIFIDPSHFECELCSEMNKDPLILPCGYTFCYECLQKLILHSSDGQMSCSLCKTPWSVLETLDLQGLWSVPNSDLNKLPKNYNTFSIVSAAENIDNYKVILAIITLDNYVEFDKEK